MKIMRKNILKVYTKLIFEPSLKGNLLTHLIFVQNICRVAQNVVSVIRCHNSVLHNKGSCLRKKTSIVFNVIVLYFNVSCV